ncbi:MAG: LacI family transcriptional regulator [Candidatus Hydrogenedentes bacterium]|nr:LacI family transcriptional regulator [Candidatus Hydrogenedentota bacterium]
MACTVNDIARVAGVSRSTVLRALSGKPDISIGTRERIQSLATSMKYRPNYIARSLTHGKTNLVGVLAKPSIYYASHTGIEAVERGLRAGGYSTLLLMSENETGKDDSVLDRLMKNRVDGVIAVPGAMTDPEAFRELIETGAKLVILDSQIDGVSVPQITGDNYGAGRLAAQHLIDLGHRRIGYLGIPRITTVGKQRLRGVEDAFSSSGILLDRRFFVEVDFSESAAEACVADMLKAKDRPTALLTRHDVVARGAMRAIFAAGLSIPRDISLVGNGDMPGTDMLRVPLTTVRFPAKQIADLCVRTLLDMLAGKEVPQGTTKLGVELVVRESTAPLE